ncbi:hypothetical protein [Synechococcus sp. UW140]|uniref:hypothetical protein n=1 Tax=Synechococcus sp. UW140 TaxID=368503 RepID=UPI003137A717
MAEIDFMSVLRQGSNVSLHMLPLHFCKLLTCSHVGESQPARDTPIYMPLLQQGRLQLDRLVSAPYPLEEINTAIAGRVMIDL